MGVKRLQKKYECNMDQDWNCSEYSDSMTPHALGEHAGGQPANAAAYAGGWRTSWPASWENGVIRNPTESIDGYLLQEPSCQISSHSDLKRRCLGVFWIESLQQQLEANNKCKMNSDMRSVSDPKIMTTKYGVPGANCYLALFSCFRIYTYTW